MEKDNFDFYRSAAIVCRRIPYGKTATYGQIALLCGKPRNAGRLGEGIPAHRVVNSRGILSGASAFETGDMQRRLLEAEGVKTEYTEDGWRVDLEKDGWHNTLEEALQFRQMFEEQGI